MARQIKVGIDYFSHDVDILQDRKVKLIKAKHGLVGYAIFLRLLEELYRDKGYYLQIDEDFNILFSDDNNININVYINVLNDCINVGLFNHQLYNNYKILTSKRIQQNYIDAISRRKEVNFIKEYLIITMSELKTFKDSKKVNVYINALNVNINALNVNKSTQSKVKESKVKNNKDIVEQDSTTSIPFKTIIDYLNKKADRNFKHTTASTRKFIKARFNDEFTLDDFKIVIDKKSKEWLNTDMDKFLRPETLFSNKFDGYLQQKEVKEKTDNFSNFEQRYKGYTGEELDKIARRKFNGG